MNSTWVLVGLELLACVRKGSTFAGLRTVLERDMVMLPIDCFVIGQGVLATPSYEKHKSWPKSVGRAPSWCCMVP